MTTSRRNTIMLWMAYTEFFYPGCELQPGYFYLSIPELYYIPEDGACIGAVGVDAYLVAIIQSGNLYVYAMNNPITYVNENGGQMAAIFLVLGRRVLRLFTQRTLGLK